MKSTVTNAIGTKSQQNWNLKVTRILSVWLDVGIKRNPNFLKVCKVVTAVFTLKVMFLI